MEGYAVSAQCMALVRDNCLIPTKDAPELGYVRESTDKQYVPDVFYKVFFINFIFAYKLIRYKQCKNMKKPLILYSSKTVGVL